MRDKVYSLYRNKIYTYQNLYGNKIFTNIIYTVTKFIRKKIYTNIIYTETKLIHDKIIIGGFLLPSKIIEDCTSPPANGYSPCIPQIMSPPPLSLYISTCTWIPTMYML